MEMLPSLPNQSANVLEKPYKTVNAQDATFGKNTNLTLNVVSTNKLPGGSGQISSAQKYNM